MCSQHCLQFSEGTLPLVVLWLAAEMCLSEVLSCVALGGISASDSATPSCDENLILWEELKMVSLFTRRQEDQREAGRFGSPGKLLYPRIMREVQRSS